MRQPYVSGKEYPLDPAPALRENSGEPVLLLFETSRATALENKTYLFKRPVEIITANRPEDAPELYRKMENALSRGLFLAGWFQYEWGYALHPGLRPLLDVKRPAGPLVWLGVFRAPEVLTGSPAIPVVDPGAQERIRNLELDITRQEYLEAVNAVKEYIASGDTYQVNYTVRAKFTYDYNPVELYLALRASQAVSYSAFIKMDSRYIISLSPELFFRIDGERIMSRPMKGTAPRGRWSGEDAAIAAQLAKDPKNRAENVMIVDLIRNDIGRLSRTGTVTVPELFTVERYNTLFQMTSTVTGELETRQWDRILEALFPCGSVTGAPKIRTMEIIAELENSPRGVYTGAVGFIKPSGDAVFNVAIRTIELQDSKGILGIGSGITIGSDPELEFEECKLKAKFIEKKFEEFSLIETLLFQPVGSGLDGYSLLDLHLSRMAASAHYFSFPFNETKLLEELRNLAAAMNAAGRPCKVRCLLDRAGGLTLAWQPLEEVREPVKIALAPGHVDSKDPFLYHKTTNRKRFDGLSARARQKGLFDYISTNEAGQLTEGSFTTLFVERDGQLLTPALECGLLPGTLRQQLLEQGKASEAILFPEDLNQAHAVYVGNSVRGLLRAVVVDRSQ